VTDRQLQGNYFAGSGADGVYLQNAAGWMIIATTSMGSTMPQRAVRKPPLRHSISDNYIEDSG
jgi:hypothetical protein